MIEGKSPSSAVEDERSLRDGSSRSSDGEIIASEG